MKCNKCGKEFNESAQFCPACGNKINAIDKDETAKKSDSGICAIEKQENATANFVENEDYYNKEKEMFSEKNESENELENRYIFFDNIKYRNLYGSILKVMYVATSIIVGIKIIKYIFWEEHPTEIKTIASIIIAFIMELAVYIILLAIAVLLMRLAEYKNYDVTEGCQQWTLLFFEIAETVAAIVALLPFVSPSDLTISKWGMVILFGDTTDLLSCFSLSLLSAVTYVILRVIKRRFLVIAEPYI